ncbi:hypothetical protein NE237_033121 [Protea cynaroides]|uniref:Uncharacterized protein n=1 Tax=Protea cynaroides TaxID=273540 RepID=A0A9Q0L5X0_9MAGN|nr:hypothetical protein NE237_033121 [Protea cynaroides]
MIDSMNAGIKKNMGNKMNGVEEQVPIASGMPVTKRQVKVKESVGSIDNATKLEAAEGKLHELKSNMATWGRKPWCNGKVIILQPEKTYIKLILSPELRAKVFLCLNFRER